MAVHFCLEVIILSLASKDIHVVRPILQQISKIDFCCLPSGLQNDQLGKNELASLKSHLPSDFCRDGPKSCTFVGIDVSGDFLEQAKANLLTACSAMREERVELIQATYMDGVKQARER